MAYQYKLSLSLPELFQLQMNEECLLGRKPEKRKSKDKGIGAGAIFGICLILVVVIAIAAWCVYAYSHPTSKSGLFFIEVRFCTVIVVRRFLCYLTD